MEAFWRKRYLRVAALWAREGKRAMSVRPDHLLALLEGYRPPPPPSALQLRVEGLQREILALRAQLASESARAKTSWDAGYATASREQADEMKRLRARVAASQAPNQKRDSLSLTEPC